MGFKRFDTAGLGKPTKTPQGFLKVDAYPTRTGIFKYRTPDGGERRELRLPDDVFHEDALASFAAAPVTDDHPSEMVSPENASEVMRGFVAGMPQRDGDRMRASLIVTDAGLISKMEAGKNQLSGGYVCDLDETPGVYRGERYDARQLNIRGNHLAIVTNGRAGEGCAARMDSGDAFGGVPIPLEDVGMTDKEIKELQEKLDAAAKENARLKDEKSKAEARADAAEEKREKATKERADADSVEKFDAAVASRVALVAKAREILGAEFKLDGLKEQAIKVAVVEKVRGKKLDAARVKDVAYVDARFDAALEDVEKTDEGNQGVEAARAAGDKVTSDTGERKDAAERWCDDIKTLWTKPIPGAINRE